MRSEGFSFGSLRVELCLPDVVFEFATVRNPNPAPMALPLGRVLKSDFSPTLGFAVARLLRS